MLCTGQDIGGTSCRPPLCMNYYAIYLMVFFTFRNCTGVPGGNSKDRMVKSSLGPRPHIITAKKTGQYACDGQCPNWKSLKVCSHTVAAAEDNHDLDAFIQWLKKAKKVPNMTELVTTNMPKGRGRKACAPPRKRSKKVHVDTHKTLVKFCKNKHPMRLHLMKIVTVVLSFKCRLAVVLLFKIVSMLVVGMFSLRLREEEQVWDSITIANRVGVWK